MLFETNFNLMLFTLMLFGNSPFGDVYLVADEIPASTQGARVFNFLLSGLHAFRKTVSASTNKII